MSIKNRVSVSNALKISIFLLLSLVLFSCTASQDTFELLTIDEENTTIFFKEKFINIDTIDKPIVNTNIFSSNSFSISFWLYPESNHNWSTLISIGDENNFLILSSKGNPDGIEAGLNIAIRKNGGETYRILSDKINTVNLYHFNHIVLTKNNNNILLFLNGALIAESKIGYNLDYLSQFPISIVSKSIFDDPIPSGYLSNVTYSPNPMSEDMISNYYSEKYLSALLELVEINETSDLNENINLEYINNSRLLSNLQSIKWKSNNEDLVTSEGFLNKDYPLIKDEHVIMSLEIKDGSQKASKDFFFTVKVETPQLIIERDSEFLISAISNIYSESDSLITELPNGSSINWMVNDDSAFIVDNKRIVKDINSSEFENIVLSAKLMYENEESTLHFPILLIDKYKAYLMSYFDEIDYENESMKMAYSYDGVNWSPLNNNEPILVPNIEASSNRLRDPFIYRNTDGSFIIVGTQGWSHPSIYLVKSPNLINFSNQMLVNLSYYEPGIQLSGERAWAPEIVFDSKNSTHIISFSDSKNGTIYYVKTDDFQHFSYPNVFFDPNYIVIDQTIFKSNLGYWLFYKDERDGAKTIFHAYSSTLDFKTPEIFDQNFLHLQKNIEGPTVFTTIDHNSTYLLFDNYKNENVLGLELELGENNRFTPLSEINLSLPHDRIRHPSVIKITDNELSELLKYYNNSDN
jgi:hypothetical protein